LPLFGQKNHALRRTVVKLWRMRSVILGLLATTVAHAQPALTPVISEPRPTEPAYYAVIAGALGATIDGDIYGSVRVEGAIHVTHLFWLRGVVETGAAAQLNFAGSDQYSEEQDHFIAARAGIEMRPCWALGYLCGDFGFDAGYRHDRNDNDPTNRRSGGDFVGRAGLDAGSRNLRIRTIIEIEGSKAGDTQSLVVGGEYLF
jgi:hypothetical protein